MTGSPLRLATSAMGTRSELALLDGCGDLRAAGEEAIDEIEGWHRRLSRFAADSLLSHINRTAARSPVHLDRETFALFEDALQVWRASAGAFPEPRLGTDAHDTFTPLRTRSSWSCSGTMGWR